MPQFDIFGVRAARGWVRSSASSGEELSVRGPYALIRHPFYSASILVLWSTTELTADRLLLGVLWTAWIVAAARLEERDLIARFGESYLQYRSRVPMLLPRPR